MRKLIELPYHQIKGRLADRFHTTLFSLQFISTKIKAGLMSQILEDYELALQECPGWVTSPLIMQKLGQFRDFLKKHVKSSPSLPPHHLR